MKSYDLILDVDFVNLRFDGKVKIALQSDADVVLNAVDLEIIRATGNQNPLLYGQSGEDLALRTGPFAGVIEIEYRGIISDKLVGFYKASFDGGYIASTQFEAASARRLLPCVDHPSYKAEFKLTIRTDKALDVISNTPQASTRFEGSKKIVEFQKTPRMSTYLLYIGIGKFDEVQEKHDGVEYAVATIPGKSSGAKFPLDVAKESVRFFEKYFGIRYALPKLHLIGVPEFAAGAMENWGAITFREIVLLVDKDSSVRIKKQVAEVTAHEVSHQWFGNLVTMKWWDDLWLNESFATFMAGKAVDAIFPQWKAWEDFIRDETAGAMVRDSLLSTHPIEVRVNSTSEVEEVFDDISYGKGASVIRMLEAYTGEATFMEGVRNYLKKYQYANATGRDLWTQIEEASQAQVTRIMSDWIKKPGYPVVTVALKSNTLSFKQERFLLSGATESSLWPIPLTLEVNGSARKVMMDEQEYRLDVPEGVQSLKVNNDQTGFYRVHYDGIYDKVLQARLSALDRFGIISDAYAFSFQGRMSFSEYLALVERYTHEKDYLPAHEVSDQLSSLYSLAPKAVRKASEAFHSAQLKALAHKNDENGIVLRGVVAARLAWVDEGYAKDRSSLLEEYNSIEPDMRSSVVTGFARSTGDLETLVKNYKSRPSEEEKSRFLGGLTSFKDPSLISRSLEMASAGEIKKQHVQSLVAGVMRNPDARDATWIWFERNFNWLRGLYEGTGIVSRLLTSMIPYLGVDRGSEVKAFFEKNRAEEAQRGIDAGLERLRINEVFLSRIASDKS